MHIPDIFSNHFICIPSGLFEENEFVKIHGFIFLTYIFKYICIRVTIIHSLEGDCCDNEIFNVLIE